MNKQYYYLALNGEYVIIDSSIDTDRLGLMGATFSTAKQAANYVARLNDEARADEVRAEEGRN